jgi:hypothetical protein
VCHGCTGSSAGEADGDAVRCPDRLGEETYRQVLELLAGLSPIVQALPPSAALVELKGALRYHGTEARRRWSCHAQLRNRH